MTRRVGIARPRRGEVVYIPRLVPEVEEELVELKEDLFRRCRDKIKRRSNPLKACKTIVSRMLSKHEKVSDEWVGCRLTPTHEVLYVATRLILEFDLKCHKTIKRLLTEIYKCEQCFNRIYLGAIYGPPEYPLKEFHSRDDYLKALELFLRTSLKYRFTFYKCGRMRGFAELPLSDGTLPIVLSRRVRHNGRDVTKLLLKYKATTPELKWRNPNSTAF